MFIPKYLLKANACLLFIMSWYTADSPHWKKRINMAGLFSKDLFFLIQVYLYS